MESRKFAFFVAWLIALMCLSMAELARAQGPYYYGPTTPVDITKFGFGGVGYNAYAHDTSLWIPNDVAVIRGVIIIPNGVHGDARGIVNNTFWQDLARMYGFALMGTRGYVCYDGNFAGTVSVDTEVPVLLSDFAWYATESGRPEIANLPMIITGWSACGQVAYGINTKIPERMITFIANKGGNYIQPPLVAAALKTPSLGVAGELDGQEAIKNNFEIHRPKGAIWAVAFEEDAWHKEGNVNGLWYTFFDHAIRARLPAGTPPLTGPVTLLDLPETSGWLAAKPTGSSGLSGTVYPYADYPGDKTTACWLMDADVANLYRGFATWGPAVTVTVGGGMVYQGVPVFDAGQTIQFNVSVDSALFPDWVSADVYDGAVKLGTVTNGGATSVSAVRPWGARGVTAIARNAAGNERTSIPKPFVVKNAVALTNTAATGAQRTSANLNATFCPAWGSYTVTAYWGTGNGGSNATAWQNSMEVGTWTGGDATNVSYTATGLSEMTDYYFTFRATSTVTGSTVWATNVMPFTTVTPNAPTSSGAALTALEDTLTALAAGNFGYMDQLGVALAAVQITSSPALGTLSYNGAAVGAGGLPLTVTAANIGNLTYQSALNGNGTSYTTMGIKVMNANNLWSAGATMTLNVTPVNDAPTSTGGSVNLDGNPLRTFSAGNFPFADVDAGNTLGAIQVTSLPTKGTLKLNNTDITVPSAVIPLANIGTLTYTAGAGYSGSDSFTFKVRDTSLLSANATMMITGSSTFAVLTAGNPIYPNTDYITNTTGNITNTVTAAALNSLSIDTTAGSNIWDITSGKNATITTGGLSMTGANNFTIQNGILRSNSTSGFFVTQNGAGTLTLGSVIANGLGASTFTKAGTGALTLSGENTYSGATTISGGILNLTHALALKNSALDTTNSVVASATAGLKTDKTTLTLGGLTGNKNLASVFTTALGGTAGTTASGGYSGVTALTLNPGSGVTTYAGSISDGTVGMSLTKTGAGTQTLSGTNNLTHATVTGGTLGITGGSLKLANGFVNAGSTSGPSIVKIDGGSLDVNSPGNNSGGLQIGYLKDTLGAIYLNSGSINSSTNYYNLHLGGVGKNNPSYGFLSITGGEIRGSQHRTRIGQYSGTGVWYQSGGSYSNASSTNWSGNIDIGSVVDTAADSNIGVVYLNNTAQFTSISPVNVASALSTSIGTLTVAGSAALTVNDNLTVGAASATTATVNLNGGTLTFKTITNNATGTFNFNGGTLKANSASASFSGSGAAYVYPGGLTFDTNGNAVTIPLALQAPAGNGVNTIPVTSSGSGYIGAPYVALSGTGTGATAVANMVDDGTGNGTYKIGSISVTSPGRNYTNIGATLSGGLPTGGTAAVLNTASATFVSNAGGGLTKVGSGTLTLNGTNTYTGNTTVSSGVLAVNGSSIPDAGKLVISGGKVNLTNAETVDTLFFGTTQQAAGTYSATGTNGTIASTHFTGTGTLRVNTSPPGSTPTITTSGTLSAMSTTFGRASDSTTFTVAGANMTAGITVTPPPGFEVSQTAGGVSGYAGSGTAITVGSSGTIATTTVYVRLAVAAPVGTYNSQNIVLSSTGATAVNVTTAASTVAKATPTVTVTGVTSFTYNGSPQGPSTANVTGSTGNVTYNYEGIVGTTYLVSTTKPTNAGNYTVTATVVANDNYDTASSAATAFTIGKATPTVTVTGVISFTYNGSPQGPSTANVSGSTGNVTYNYVGAAGTTYPVSGTKPTSAGSYTVTATVVVNDNYDTASSAATAFTIGKATPTVTLAVSNSQATYDGTAKSATVIISASSVLGAVQSVSTGGAATQTAAGIYAVTANFVPTDTTNYNTLTELAAGNFVIGGITIPVINGNFETEYATNTNKTTNWVKLTSWSLKDNIGSVDITGAFSSSADGSKFTRFTYNDSGAEQNFDTNVAVGDTLSVTFNIGRATNAWSGANTTGVVYFKIGSQYYEQACDVSSHPVGTWKSFTFTTTATNAGALSLGFRVAPSSNNQYVSVDGVSHVTRISSATPTITTAGTLSILSTTYGTFSAPTSFTVSGANMAAGIAVTPPTGFEVSKTGGASGYAGSGTAITVGSSGTIATTTVYVRLAATATVGSSPYSGNITCGSPGAITQNVATASSTVTKATPTATLAVNNSPTTYDGTAKAATVIINASSVPGGVQNIRTGDAATQTAAGSYAVTADFVPTDAANYNTLTAQGAGNFVINPIPTYTVSYNSNGGTGSQADSSSPYNSGTTVTVLGAGTMARTGYAFTGWNTQAGGGGTSYSAGNTFTIANNVTLHAQWTLSTITLTGTLGAVNTTYGTASVTPTSFSVAASNLTPASGNLTVTAPTGYEVSLNNSSNYSSNLSVSYSSSTLASTPVYARLAPTAGVVSSPYSGNITVAGGGASPKTIATASSTVAKATATVVVTPYSVTYDGNPHSATVASITGVNGETATTVGTVTLNTTHTDAGTYANDSWSLTGSVNYNNIASTTLTNTINKATPTVTVTGVTSFTYNGLPQGPSTANVTGSTGNVSYSYVGNGGTTYQASATRPTNAGSYTVTAMVAAAGNYDTASSTATAFSIGKATPTVIVTPYTVTYDGNPHSATVASITGVNGETATTVGTVTLDTTHTNAGTYATDSWSLTGTANYNNIASTTLTNTINKATPTVTLAVNNSPTTYDGTAKAATVSITSSSVPGGVLNVLTGGAATQTAAGSYAVTANFVPTDAANYNTLIAQNAGNFVIAGSYTSWATTNGAGSQTMNQDHDQDGVPNGIEHFLGGNVQTTGYTALPGVNKAADGKLSVTWTKSADFAGAYGTGYVIQTADNPAGTWDDVPATGGAVTVSGNDVIYTFPTPGSASKFVRLKVMGAP